jgi:DNA-binding PadR family transcriptional regulator
MTLRITPSFLHVLLSLVDGPRHGYGIMLEIAERTGDGKQLGPSSLYYALDRLESARLIEEVDAPEPDEEQDERRRYYQLTAEGRSRLGEETRALAGIVNWARSRGVLG